MISDPPPSHGGKRQLQRPLVEAGVEYVYHYAPLHYLPFILRTGELRSKSRLRSEGFGDSHFRSTSATQDVHRGFESYLHATLSEHPPILTAKVGRGFPHFEVAVPAIAVEQQDYLLCRFNIAKTRYFRGAKQEPPESEANGRYLEGLRLPVARTTQEKRDLLRLNLGCRMIEVLVPGEMALPQGSILKFFSKSDLQVAGGLVKTMSTVSFHVRLDESLSYPSRPEYRDAVMTAIEITLRDEQWKGNGLEFDKV